MSDRRPSIVIVDDDPIGSRLLASSLERDGFAPHVLPDGRDARTSRARRSYAIFASSTPLSICPSSWWPTSLA